MWERSYSMENGSESFLRINPLVTREKKNKRRFSEEQIRSLETIFDSENKLEPQKKMQLARELGLQPRQIAIWFQNRRARCKSKQLEREYSVLRANYDALLSSFESLKQEKQALLKQVQKLRDMIDKPRGSESAEENRWHGLSSDRNSNDGGSENGEKPGLLSKEGSDLRELVHSDGEDSKNTGYCEEPELLNMTEFVCGSLTFPEKLCNLDSSCYPGQSSSSLQWWELWP